MLRFERCDFCRGVGMVECLEERTSAGNWVPNDDPLLPAMADAMIALHPDKLRWHDVECPHCAGAKEIALEFVACKVF